MAFPWIRRDAGTQVGSAQRPRRNRGQRAGREEAPRESSRDSKERLHQRLSWTVGGILILVVVGVLAAGYYEKFYRPPRVWAGKVRGVAFTMGDLVERIRVEQGLLEVGQDPQARVDLSRRPFEYLQGLLQAEILRQEAPRLGITITEDHVDTALRARFYPDVSAGQATDPGQLDREFQNKLQIYLTRTGLSEKDYRGIVEEVLRKQALYFLLSRGIPEDMEQVEVEWIRQEITGPVTAAEVLERLQSEDFAAVARSVGVSGGFADPSGYVGWVPRQAFPEIGRVLFGDEETGLEALDVGETGRPMFATDAIYIVRKLSEAETRPLSDIMRAKVNFELVQEWEKQQLKRGSDEKWLEMKFNSELYDWVADQVAVSASRNQQGRR